MPKEVDYFKLVVRLKEQYELEFGIHPTHLIIGHKEYEKMENSSSIIDRLIYIKDITSGTLGTHLCGLNIIKTTDIKRIKVGRLI